MTTRTLIGHLPSVTGTYEHIIIVQDGTAPEYTETFVDSTGRPHILMQRPATISDLQVTMNLADVRMLDAEGHPVTPSIEALYLRVFHWQVQHSGNASHA